MKPKWEDAPAWANWLCSYQGTWYWAEKRPKVRDQFGARYLVGYSRKMEAVTDHMEFEDSVEIRPEAT